MESEASPYLDVESAHELFGRAKSQATAVAEPEYQRTVELYYIARYLVSVFESRDQKLPLQVWNEYRNAFDHFARHLTVSQDIAADDVHHHLRKMEGHIQRAALDVCKFLCIYFADFCKTEILSRRDVMALVTDGAFLTQANELAASAETALLRAKEADSNLGEDANVNDNVVELYCEAVFDYMKIESLYRTNNENITKALLNSKRMAATSIWKQVLIAVGVAIAFFLLGMYFD